jgi:hypothetical protein
MIALDRIERASRQYAWLPPSLRARRRLATGAVWAGAGVLLGGVLVAAPPLLGSWQLLLGLGVAGGLVGDRVGTAMVRRHVARLAHGEVALARVGDEAEGALVHVRGRVRATDTLASVLHGVPGVYRRLVLRANGARWIHEAAVAFDVVDAQGVWIRVEPRGARLLAPVAELIEYPAHALAGERVTPSLLAVIAAHTGITIPASELVLRDGDEVELVGHKSQMAEVSGQGGSFREPPQRALLRSGNVLPLLVTPVVTSVPA